MSHAAQHFILREAHPEQHAALRLHIERLWGSATCHVRRCDRCGFCFADPFIGGDATFYDLAFDRSGYPSSKWEFEVTRDCVAGLAASNPEGFTLLEVGAGNGSFVKTIAPSLIPKGNILCTEYSAYGRGEIERYGIACRSEDVRDLPLERYASHFDAVCLFQVLEHLDRLDDLFAQLAALSTPRGQLFIAVPNEQRIAFNEANGSLLDMPPNHVGRWTRASLGIIGMRHGWRLVEHEVERGGALANMAGHIAYRYVRKRQEPRSLANRIERIRSRRARRPLQGAVAALYGLASLGALTVLARTEGLGDSQWARLERV